MASSTARLRWTLAAALIPIVAIAASLLSSCGADGDPSIVPDADRADATARDVSERDVVAGDGDAGEESDTDERRDTAADGTLDGSESDLTDAAADTRDEPAPALEAVANGPNYAVVDEEIVLDGSASPGAVAYQWTFGDGRGWDEPRGTPRATVSYEIVGRFRPELTVFGEDGEIDRASFLLTVTAAPSFVPRRSGSIAVEADATRAWAISPDSSELTLVAWDDDGAFSVAGRVATCRGPRSVAVDAGRVAVACPADDRVRVHSAEEPTSTTDVAFEHGAAPFGVVIDEGIAYVTLQGRGELAVIELSEPPAERDRFGAIADARALALLPDGRVAVSRWRSPDERAEIAVVDPTDGRLAIWTLQRDPQPPSDTETGGIPSYLTPLLVPPSGTLAALPSLQANDRQGLFLDGRHLTHETTVRAVLSFVDLSTGEERFELRKQFDDRGLPSAGVFSSRGDYLFVAMRGSRSIERIDAFSGTTAGTILSVGFAPSGLALTPDDRFLLVDAYLSRQLVVFDVSDFSRMPRPLFELPLAGEEPLAADVLRGKQLFNDSFDTRLARDGYIACAHCHLDGASDNRVWDFTDRGEGLRNTIDLRGRAGTGHGLIHWSANFDEVQDFEHDIRGPFAGTGLMTDAQFHTGSRDTTLGDQKAGVNEELDALAAYVTSLGEYPRSPMRREDGGLTAAAERGRELFVDPARGCTDCHAGPAMTDSGFGEDGAPILHDVGTLRDASGERLGGMLPGIDTPTLRGLFDTAPYLHDGSASTLQEVLSERNPDDEHGVTSDLDEEQLSDLVEYLLSLEGPAGVDD